MNKSIAEKVLQVAMQTGGDFAEIFLEDRLNNSISMRQGKTESLQSARIHGAGVRVYDALQAYYVFTNDTSEQGLIACAKRAAVGIANAKLHNIKTLQDLHDYNGFDIQVKPNQVESKQKIEALRIMHKVAMAEGASQAVLAYKDSVQNVWIANTEGRFVADTRYYTRVFCNAVVEKNGEMQTGTQNPGAHDGFNFVQNLDLEQVAKSATRTALTMIDAPYCPAGQMPVVIGNGFGGVIFHEACGHSLEATAVAFGNSEFCGKLGKQIAASCVTAIEDGTIPYAWGSLNIDDEGTPTNRLVLIENGILKNYMVDRLNGRRMGMAPTGSARRESYRFAPTSRMRNTFIDNGTDSVEEMIATMGNGLLAKKLGGGSVNPATGEFNFSVQEGYLVKDGKITSPVRGASLIGKGSQILMQIDRVGNNLSQAQGMCGSSSGSVPTNVGQPYIRVKEITVGGVSK
ncbi:MAG: TldD/PmbA family protein [Eubacteriales bacterium]|nr:TldD/PmbA family protein [Eubacteriales bacterium]